MTLSKLRVVLEATTGQFNRAMKATANVFKRTGTAAKGLGAQLLSLKGAFAAMLGVFAVRRMAEITKSIFDMGAAVAETQSKFTTVFGAATKQVQGFLDEFATMSGLSRQVAQDLTSTTGAIIQGLGFTQQASADLSEQVVRMAGDFSSFNDLRTEDTLNAVTTALVGEREQLKRLGVVLTEEMVKQRVLADNIGKTTKQITQQDKTLVSLALIYEKAGVQMGDLARTQTSAANRAKQLGATWVNLRNTIATILMPTLISMMEAVGNNRIGLEMWERELRENAATVVAWAAVVAKGAEFIARALALPIKTAFNLGQSIVEIGRMIRAFATNDVAAMDAAMDTLNRNWRQVEKGLAGVSFSMVDFQKLWNEAITSFLLRSEEAAGGLVRLEFVMPPLIEQVKRLDATLAGFALNFSDRIGRATTEGAAAFDGFVERVLQGLARIAAELAVFNALKSLFPNSGFISAFGTSLGIAASASGGGGAAHGVSSAFVGGGAKLVVAGGGGGKPVVFNQVVNFNIAALDGPSVAQVIQSQKRTIASVVAEAAQESTAFKRALR